MSREWKDVKEELDNLDKTCNFSVQKNYKELLNSFENMDEVLDNMKLAVKLKPRMQSLINRQKDILEHYELRKDFHNVITVKLVIPGKCNMNCPFCYNKFKDDSAYCDDREAFLENFIDHIYMILSEVNGRYPVSLDITGYEPLINIAFIKKVFSKIRTSGVKDKLCRVTLTTNGVFLTNEIIPYMRGAVDYVNISVHDFRDKERNEAFGVEMESLDYENRIFSLLDNGITTSASAVIYKEIDNFEIFLYLFIGFCYTNGFQSLRFRNDVYWKDSKFLEYMEETMKNPRFIVVENEDTKDARWCRLYDTLSGLQIFFLKGVEDTSVLSPGIEYVIDSDGECYVDFYRRTKFIDKKFPAGYIFDKKD